MNIPEFKAKEILRSYGLKVPMGIVADTPAKAVDAARAVRAKTGCEKWVVKAQVSTGGRGKAGGVRIATGIDQVGKIAEDLLGLTLHTKQSDIKGEVIKLILIEEFIPFNKELGEMYFSLMMNRKDECHTAIFSEFGGIDIEEIRWDKPSSIQRFNILPFSSLESDKIETLHENMDISGPLHAKFQHSFQNFAEKIFDAYFQSDALLLEINPLVFNEEDELIALDAKIILDDNALFRHKEIWIDRPSTVDDNQEEAAKKINLNYVRLNGNVGCMVNGAGLAMATMDLISLAGGTPANFLDVGGKADSNTVEHAFQIIMSDPCVKLVFVNIFGGIVRCDRVASGVLSAMNHIHKRDIPVILRLQGTNMQEAFDIIDRSGVDLQIADDLVEAEVMIKEKLKEIHEHNCK